MAQVQLDRFVSGVPGRVLGQVGQHPPQPLRVAAHRRVRRVDVRVPAVFRDPGRVQHGGGQLREHDPARPHPPQRAAVRDGQVREPVEHVPQVRGVLGEQTGGPAPGVVGEPIGGQVRGQRRERGDRRAELVQHDPRAVEPRPALGTFGQVALVLGLGARPRLGRRGQLPLQQPDEHPDQYGRRQQEPGPPQSDQDTADDRQGRVRAEQGGDGEPGSECDRGQTADDRPGAQRRGDRDQRQGRHHQALRAAGQPAGHDPEHTVHTGQDRGRDRQPAAHVGDEQHGRVHRGRGDEHDGRDERVRQLRGEREQHPGGDDDGRPQHDRRALLRRSFGQLVDDGGIVGRVHCGSRGSRAGRRQTRLATVPDGRIRVVIVDDHALFSQGLALLLESRAGDTFTVEGSATAGEEAVALVGKHRADIAIVDLALPPLGGVETIRRIKASYPSTRVLALSGTEDLDLAAAALRAGAEGYLGKSADPEVLVAPLLAISAGVRVLRTELLDALLLAADRTADGLLDRLSDADVELWRLLAQGLETAEIARPLLVSERTAKRMIASLLHRLGVSNRIEAAALAGRCGLLDAT